MEVKPWTTYKDKKGRYWVVICLDHYGLHHKIQETIQKVILYQVGSDEVIQRPTFGEFLSMVEKKQMQLYKL